MSDQKLSPEYCPERKFDSVEEAAQEKTDHAWNTVFKNVNWDKFEELRKKQ